MALVQYSYIGKGSVYIRKRGSSDPRVRMGNVKALRLEADEDKQEEKDYENAGGGNLETVSRINSVSLAMETTNLSPANLAIGLRGAISEQLSVTPIADEAVAVAPGGLSVLARIPNPAVAMTVENTGGTVTYVENTDYIRTRSGFEVLAGGAIVAGSCNASYTPLPSSVVQALVNSSDEYELLFEGLNEARSGAPVIVAVHRMKFSPSGTDLIGDEFGVLEMEAEVLADGTKVGVGISKFFKADMAVVSA